MPGITLILSALRVLLLLVPVIPIVRQRRRQRIGRGWAPAPTRSERRIRVQGNFIEYGPMALLLALLELCGLPATWLWSFGGVLMCARLLHAYGLSHNSGSSPGRVLGAMLTFANLLAMAGTGLWLALR
ncbi:MAPEG family protein [Stenotrophomonas sp. YIM B06876]|uniref:MAPEG family protein n=1 Tax=Stenotrophomonas sp. YIM B06876 TaxID=3060211 RepID=UPI0027394125|nr:MAPEG family protein [Stenotrophomonas sp. YIM B06876]